MKKICINCGKEIEQGSKIYYTLDKNLLSKPCCSLKCAKSFKKNTILNLEKIIRYIKKENISERLN
ncbi:MAG: hypothetical protein Q4B63_05455 [Clostridium perfringens]|nr:hypothetical protein [Clostridium perfringens]